MIRDEEIQRLINYIKGIGLTVSFSSKKSDCSAEWYINNSGIVIYRRQNKPKIDIVLDLIHELGHALHNIHKKNRTTDPKFERALDHIIQTEIDETDSKKRQRKIILDNEVAGTWYWHVIYKETNMKFPIWKMEAQMDFDIYQYEVFHETGKFPKRKDRLEKFKEIYNSHKENFYAQNNQN